MSKYFSPKVNQKNKFEELKDITLKTLKAEIAESSAEIPLPKPLIEIVQEILKEFAQGNTIAIIPQNEEIGTTEAAKMIGVSRPHLVKLLENGEISIPFRKVGSKRRIKIRDIITYKTQLDESRDKALEELVREAQELKLGY